MTDEPRVPDPADAADERHGNGAPRRGLIVAGAIVAVIALIAAVLVVMTGGDDDDNVSAGGSRGTTTADSDTETTAVKARDELPDDDIELTADTVIVRSDGGDAVRSFGDDGTTIVIDGDAEGADELAAGKVMLLTGVTVVRVASIEEDGGDLVIEGARVTLPELIENGELSWSDVEVDGDEARILEVETDESAAGAGGDSEPMDLIVDRRTTADVRAKPRTVTGMAGEMKFALTYEPVGAGHNLHLQLTLGGDLRGTIDADVKIRSFAHSGSASVVGARIQHFDFETEDFGGEALIETDLQGLQNVASLTTPPFFKLPVSIEFPVLISGIPFTLSIGATIQVNLSMALANSSLSGRAEIEFGGDAGFHFKGGSATLDGKRTQESPDLLEFLKGAAPGPVGVVFTTELPKVGFGLGYSQVSATVYLSNGMVASQTILPAPAQCTAMNVAYVLAAGVEAKLLGHDIEIGRRAIVDERWNYQVPQDQRCNAPQ